ncbi:MAG: hypothetical protein KC609_21070, partial [Myxococcales bacterium]|nr:hypothetical protein [Myxococcales bacterium]
LRRRLPGPGFSIVLERPFVVIGNDTPERVRQYAARTVRWAVQRLKQSYFTKDPKQILNIWLFRDARSYRHYVTILYGEKPDTPYGFYSSSKRGLFMNIATGGGTLVHEIVHPFIEANFPSCPAWFNEGLGSLYEQASERDGQIIGLTNWRLAGLQTAIRKGGLTRFRSLLGQNEKQFYRDVHGTNYAQSRYLLYYLQERRLLRRYYRAFLENRRRDPSGYKTLRKILGNPDMTQFQRQWERYVLGLRFNG